MKYFTSGFTSFLADLEQNNNKDWFHENSNRYEQDVKKPFAKFVADLIEASKQINPAINIEAKNAIFRINRDIRFSKDKRPYKASRSAIISPAGRSNHQIPGFYIDLSPKVVFIGGGAYTLDKDALHRVRQEIVFQPKAFQEAINHPDFVSKFGQVLGEKNKVLPAEFKEEANHQPLLFNKSFYCMAELPADIITSDQFMEQVLSYFKACHVLNAFLTPAIEG